jgi:hypothetical protein
MILKEETKNDKKKIGNTGSSRGAGNTRSGNNSEGGADLQDIVIRI